MDNISVTTWCQHMMKEQVCCGDICIDATAGNGNDTVFLAELVGETGKVFAFDIQKEALAKTRNRAEKWDVLEQVTLFHAGHETMKERLFAYMGKVSCIVFNLGYLPGSDHTLRTQKMTSLQAISQGLELLKPGGIISLCLYEGCQEGIEEKEAILSYLGDLPAKEFLVITSHYYNRPNNPPMPVLVIKIKDISCQKEKDIVQCP